MANNENTQEGPIAVNIPARTMLTCNRCKYYSTHLIRTGRHPKYAKLCTHEHFKDETHFLHKLKGKEITDNDDSLLNIITPEWCPFLNNLE